MNELQQQTKAFIESECAKLNCAGIAAPLTEGYAAICESESDASIYKMAMDITNQFFDKETVGQIVEKFNDMRKVRTVASDKDIIAIGAAGTSAAGLPWARSISSRSTPSSCKIFAPEEVSCAKIPIKRCSVPM